MNNLSNSKFDEMTEADMTNCSDARLITLFIAKQASSDSAFAELVKRYHRWIFRRCLFRLGNPFDAEDACQDVILRIYAKLHQYQGLAQFKNWLSVVINNYCATFALQKKRYINKQPTELSLADQTDILQESFAEINEQQLAFEPSHLLEQTEMINRTFSLLPENTQQLLKLRFYAEKSLEEISVILCLTLSATKARLYRAIELFKHHYHRLGGADTLIPLQ